MFIFHGMRFAARRGVSCTLCVAMAVLFCAAGPAVVWAQARRAVPREDYFLSLSVYYSGDYKTALKAFRRAARGGVRSTEGRWIDSICFHTMIGECYYQMGDPGLALDQYDKALTLYLAHSEWMLRIEFPPAIRPFHSAARSTITWGASARRSKLGQFPKTMLSRQGRLDNRDVVQRGGVFAPPSFHPVHVAEIVRCTALALRRRLELMGPICRHSPRSRQLLQALLGRPTQPNHWSQAWIEVQLGLAYAGVGKSEQAISHLQRSLLVGGEYDHPLTATALLELGKLAFAQRQYEAAATYFLEATIAAAPYTQADVMEEGFRYALVTHLVSGRGGIYPPLLRTVPWAKSHRLRALQASLLLLAGENYATERQLPRAATLLEEARRTIGRREMLAGNIGARFQYQAALVNFQSGNIKAGNRALTAAMSYQARASHRLFQISLADMYFQQGSVTPRIAGKLFANVLREPTADDWSVDPMETLSVVLTPHPLPMEHWFEVALSRKEHELALEIADRIRRHRFHSTLPLGGRLLSLRWILEAHESTLSQKALLQRQDLLMKYPRYAELAQQTRALRNQLSALPLVPEQEDVKRQKELLKQLAGISLLQEMILREIAVRREPSEFVFPPLRKTKEIQAAMPKGQLALVFFSTSRYVVSFLFSKDKYTHRQIKAPARIRANIVSMLRKMGNFDGNQALTADQLQDDAWKKSAHELLGRLAENIRPDFWREYDELVLVPDGVLWYVPFEALPSGKDANSPPLISKIRIRYVPTASLIVPDSRGRKPVGKTAVVVGKLFRRDDPQVAADTLEDLRHALPGSETLTAPLPAASSVFATAWDRLVVLDDVQPNQHGPYNWAPAQIDRGRPGSSLASWFPLPWGGPDEIVLLGYHTAAENNLKRGATGNEIFLSACGLFSTGTRTVLLSRWRLGGQMSIDLLREFLQELPHTTASDAWQRSVLLAREAELDPQREPRLKLAATDQAVKADHPFFWSGYLLLDSGSPPHAKEMPEPKPEK